MLHEPAAPEPSSSSRFPPEKIVATALVALLHIALIWMLLRATLVQVAPPPTFLPQPITLWLQKPAEKKEPPKPKPEEKPKPEAAAPVERAIGPPLPAPTGAPPGADYNGLRAFGRYLNNCSNLSYENLSAKELAHCLGNQWDKTGNAKVRLGTEAPSIWKDQMDKRKAPVKPFEHDCPPDKLNSNLSLPCFN